MEKKVRCDTCGKTFEVVGSQGNMKEDQESVSCPYCSNLNEVLWPIDKPFFVRMIPSQM